MLDRNTLEIAMVVPRATWFGLSAKVWLAARLRMRNKSDVYESNSVEFAMGDAEIEEKVTSIVDAVEEMEEIEGLDVRTVIQPVLDLHLLQAEKSKRGIQTFSPSRPYKDIEVSLSTIGQTSELPVATYKMPTNAAFWYYDVVVCVIILPSLTEQPDTPFNGVSERCLTQLPIYQYQPDESCETCLICLQQHDDEVITNFKELPCTHKFHSACLYYWFQLASTCPHCRDDVNGNANGQ
ncbi:hypothetical protein DFS34DRAFT_412982 [Phlyctochytrium arcticum]|nr:hypothetical protein DFS34DRAFT_412982 [Phlyctochytrium arcticum]